MENYKLYIRLNDKNEIVHAFTTGFESPQESDVLYLESSSRQVADSAPELLNLLDSETMEYRLKYVDGKVVDKTEEDYLPAKKELRKKYISGSFENALQTGSFDSITLGIKVDCRRSTTKNDLQNVQGLISSLKRNAKTKVIYVGCTEMVEATVQQLEDLCYEMEDYVLSLYQKKWQKESEVDAITIETMANLNNITW